MSVGICPLAVAAYVIGILCQGLMTNHLSYVMRYIHAILGLLCHMSHCQIVVPKSILLPDYVFCLSNNFTKQTHVPSRPTTGKALTGPKHSHTHLLCAAFRQANNN